MKLISLDTNKQKLMCLLCFRVSRSITHLVGHEEKRIVDVDSTTLNLSNNDGTEVVVLLRNGEHDGAVDITVGRGHTVEEGEESWGASESSDKSHEYQIKEVQRGRKQEEIEEPCSEPTIPLFILFTGIHHSKKEDRYTYVFQGQTSLETCSLMLAPV